MTQLIYTCKKCGLRFTPSSVREDEYMKIYCLSCLLLMNIKDRERFNRKNGSQENI
jgi:hypothetical protein